MLMKIQYLYNKHTKLTARQKLKKEKEKQFKRKLKQYIRCNNEKLKAKMKETKRIKIANRFCFALVVI